jgi:hypothetical protein
MGHHLYQCHHPCDRQGLAMTAQQRWWQWWQRQLASSTVAAVVAGSGVAGQRRRAARQQGSDDKTAAAASLAACIPISKRVLPYENEDWHIPIWKHLITVSIWGLRSSGSLFPYGDHRMETSIDVSPFWYRDCPLPYGNFTLMDPCYHMGIPIWKQGLTHPYMKMINHRFYMGIENFGLHISIWESPYGNRDWRLPISIWGLSSPQPFSMRYPWPFGNLGKNYHTRIINHLVSPFPYVNPCMETGREPKKFAFGDSPFP